MGLLDNITGKLAGNVLKNVLKGNSKKEDSNDGGILGSIAGSVLGNVLGGSKDDNKNDSTSAIIKIVMGLITSSGLSKIVNTLSSSGLSKQVASWIGKGKKLPVSGDQIFNALGADFLKPIASKTGLDTKGVASSLATVLPDIIDKFTPDGKVDDDVIKEKTKDDGFDLSDVGDIIGGLSKFLK